MTARPDLYTQIHKAIRTILFDAAGRVGRTDFGSPAETETTFAVVARMLRLLRSHAHHEDTHVMPLLREAAPEVARVLDSDHLELEVAHEEVDHLMARLTATPAG